MLTLPILALRSARRRQTRTDPLAERIAILVTGMHRSGTSAIARTFSLLGARLPDDLVPANEGNPHGHWEPTAIVDLNDRMLADAGSDLYSTLDIEASWFDTPRAATFVEDAKRVLAATYRDDAFVVVKDPRVALLLPIWDRALTDSGYRIVHVIPLRHPQDVAASLRRRHLKTIPYDAWVRPRGELVWLRYMLAAVRGSRGRQRSFLSYGTFLADWRGEMRRVGLEIDLIWPRLGPADREIDAFLHGNELADRGEPARPSEAQAQADAEFGDIAGRLYAVLRARGDDVGAVDAIADDFARRSAGARDLIRTLEALYPVIWAQFTDARDLRRSLELGQQAEGNLHGAFQQLWSDLTRTTDEKGVLRQDLTATARRIAGLDKALADVSRERDQLKSAGAAAERQSDELRLMVDELRLELQSVIDDREAVRSDLEAHATTLAGQVSERDGVIVGMRQQVRVPMPPMLAKPFRLLARLGRR